RSRMEDRLADVLIAVRALHLAATGMLVGTVIFQGLIAAPVFHRIGDATGGRVGGRFTRWTVWVSPGGGSISGAAWAAGLGRPGWRFWPRRSATPPSRTRCAIVSRCC